MPRPEKVQAVAEIKERIEGAQAVFLAEYAGLSVKDQQALRRSLRAGGAEFKVVKMTLARRAADELELEGVDELLLGPTGLTFADGDPVTAAKALKDFARDHEVFVVKGGLLGTDFLSPERVSELADIEPREVLLAKIAGAAKAPMANLAGLMAAMPQNLASMLQQLVDKKEAAGPAAETEPGADADTQAETEAEAAPEPEPAETEPEPDAEPDAEPEADADAELEAEAKPEADAGEAEPEADADTQPEPDARAQAETAAATDPDAEETAEPEPEAGDDGEEEDDDASDADASDEED
jgi:large subunit ribosomal protein L10